MPSGLVFERLGPKPRELNGVRLTSSVPFFRNLDH